MSSHLLDLSQADVHSDSAEVTPKRKKTMALPPKKIAPVKGKKPIETDEEDAPKKKLQKGVRVRGHLGVGGHLSIRHTMRDVHLEGVALALVDGETHKVWIQLAKRGSFRGHAQGAFELSTRTFEDIIRNFKATTNQAVPIDFEHASEQEPTSGSIPTDGAPAQGWIVDMKIDGGELFGLVEWLPKAREYIKSGQYKFLSPAVRLQSKDRVTGQQVGARLTSAALTNNPFLDGMVPLAAKDGAQALADTGLDGPIAAIREALDAIEDHEAAEDEEVELDDDVEMTDADEDTQTTVGDSPSTEAETTMAADKEAALELSETKNKLADTSLRLKDAEARATSAEGELKTLKDTQTKRDEEDAKSRVEEAFDTYKDARKLVDADKAMMSIVYKADAKAFDDRYPRVKASERHLLRDMTEGRGVAQGAVEQPKGAGTVADVSNETFNQTTKRLMKDGLSYIDASNKAAQLRG